MGKLVRLALDKQVRLSDLSLADFSATHPALDDSIKSVLALRMPLPSLSANGSTAPHEVAKQIKHWQELVR